MQGFTPQNRKKESMQGNVSKPAPQITPKKAPSAQAQAMNQQPDSVPAMVKPGEYVLPADTVDAVGGPQALDEVVQATHTQAPNTAVVPQGFEPQYFFSNAGAVPDEEKRRLAQVPASMQRRENTTFAPDNSINETPAAPQVPAAPVAPIAPAATARATNQPLDAQAAADRAKIGAAWDTVKDVNDDAGRAIADVAMMVPRGLAGAYDSAVIRPMRAFGIDAGYLSPHLVPKGVDPASMTPFTDQKRMQQQVPAASTEAAPAASTAKPDPATARQPMQNDRKYHD